MDQREILKVLNKNKVAYDKAVNARKQSVLDAVAVGVSISVISTVGGVSRQTIYTWIDEVNND